jgi:GNAT superfamily N-acetyltransferase
MNNAIETCDSVANIRLANKNDVNSIIILIQGLADHEKHTGSIASKQYIESSFFDTQCPIEIYVIEIKGTIIGMGHIMMFPSTFSGKHQIFLQDFVILKEFRGKGHGREFIKFISRIALERNCKKITWNFFAWNEEAASFYKKLG